MDILLKLNYIIFRNLSHNNIRNMPKELGKLTNLKNL